ncbi:Holliday junction resolvase RuvX [Vulcaniibacterium tengchongense]|uniref:Putative pre-16S rRNA nuclease n=1 Tax=Vulcaniibacterium tengchongense TaxID=1273429 RepID=A0A3N4W728_9GAMM|nr:Holliday junction resolvase RuvX [Vulcaniibacterium tengchongense]RPE81004.1 putative Holliday junction resolvase [Vulcaniibacterium tengchongense]
MTPSEPPLPAQGPGRIRRDGTVLGFDVGARRIGVAVGSAFGHGARALAVIDVHAHGPDWALLDRLRKEWRPDGLIVGDPMSLEGGDQPARRRAHAFARALHARYGLPVALVDERASSIEAAHRFAADRAQGRKRRRDAEALDAVAAAVIIERWLQSPDDALDLSQLDARPAPPPTA